MSVLTNPMLRVAQLEKLSFESLADIVRQRGATIHPNSSAISKDEIMDARNDNNGNV